MKVKISEIRKVVREELTKYLEDTDRVRRHKDGYGDDLEEDTDRVRRHNDGYGDALEECGDDSMLGNALAQDHLEPDGDELPKIVVIPLPLENKQVAETKKKTAWSLTKKDK